MALSRMSKVPLCKAVKWVEGDPEKGYKTQAVRCVRNEGHLPSKEPLHYGLIKKDDGSHEIEAWS